MVSLICVPSYNDFPYLCLFESNYWCFKKMFWSTVSSLGDASESVLAIFTLYYLTMHSELFSHNPGACSTWLQTGKTLSPLLLLTVANKPFKDYGSMIWVSVGQMFHWFVSKSFLLLSVSSAFVQPCHNIFFPWPPIWPSETASAISKVH